MIKIPLLDLGNLIELNESIESWSVKRGLFIGALLLRSKYGFHIICLVDLLILLKVADYYTRDLKGIGALHITSFSTFILIQDNYLSSNSIPLESVDGWLKDYPYLSYMKSLISCYIKGVELERLLGTSYRYEYKVEKPEALIEERLRKIELTIRELERSHPLMKGIV